MRIAITTKWLAPTEHRGSRVKAIARVRVNDHPEMSLTDPWDWEGNVEANHCRVAKLLAHKLNWHGVWFGGALPDGTGFAYVNISAEHHESHQSQGRLDHDWFYLPRNG